MSQRRYVFVSLLDIGAAACILVSLGWWLG